MKIGDILRDWYKKNARDLPWRRTNDPYRIWVSEIILQQTQVRQGTGYFLRFMENFPDIQSLAASSLEEVLRVWQGLGYYSRARNLHAAARHILSEHNGKLPESFVGLRKIAGIGDYTAAAIASIAFREPVVAIDGNVSRVISRVFGISTPVDTAAGRKLVWEAASGTLDTNEPGISNQALMEFGALQCKPVSPLCNDCPLSNQCRAFQDGNVEKIPVKNARIRIRERWFYYFIISWKNNVIIQQRSDRDIWRSLFQFPLIESERELTDEKVLAEFFKNGTKEMPDFILTDASPPLMHQLSHQRIRARFFHIELVKNFNTLHDGWIMVDWERLDDYPVPRLIEKYLEKLNGEPVHSQ